jgi:transposase InsO family protein
VGPDELVTAASALPNRTSAPAASVTNSNAPKLNPSPDGSRPSVSCTPIPRCASTFVPEAGAQCGSSARWDLCGGPPARAVPTAILYVILDVFSRYVVGWMIAHAEQAALAERLLAERLRQAADPPSHPDRARRPGQFDDLQAGRHAAGRPWGDQKPLPPARPRRQPVLQEPVQDVEVPARLPDRFGSIQDARAFCQQFFGWYNAKHRHLGIAMMTPRRSTTATLLGSTRPALRCWPPPTPPIPSASCAGRQHPNPCPPLCGSTRPSRHSRTLSKQPGLASHMC